MSKHPPERQDAICEQEAKGRWYRCTQREESIKEDLLAWHWRLGYLGGIFLLLVIVRSVLKQSLLIACTKSTYPNSKAPFSMLVETDLMKAAAFLNNATDHGGSPAPP